MFCPRLNTLSVCITMLLALAVESADAYSLNPFTLSQELTKKLEEKNFLPTTEYYVAERWLYLQGLVPTADLADFLKGKKSDACAELPAFKDTEDAECVDFHDSPFLYEDQPRRVLLVAKKVSEKQTQILQIFDPASRESLPAWPVSPHLLAQTVGTQPIMQIKKPLSEMPAACSQAVLSIEDTSFLEHGGVSITGTLRAFIKNITSGRKSQGGSTITQQLVKNYFLTSERTYKRKFQEIMLAVLLESQFTKDQILETYLNIIYMAQNGPYQVVGYPAASEFYFQKPIQDLVVPECALLAAILNGPGVFNPFRNPDKSLARRNRVLEKMLEQGFISKSQYEQALTVPLPIKKPVLAAETSPYFLDAARSELTRHQISVENKKILLTLDLEAQTAAQSGLQKHIETLEEKNPTIKKLKTESKKNLEGLVLSTDQYGRALAAVGGRSFRQSQFNRIVQSRRQVGSLIKPFVYLAALDKLKMSPDALLQDEKWELKIHGKSWSPMNYDRKFHGPVPLYYALKMSLNAPIAKLGYEVGLETVIEYLKILGVESPLQPHPALALGAAEMTAVEMMQAYSALARFGKIQFVSFIDGVWHSNNQPVEIETVSSAEAVLKPESAAVIVGILKHTLISGTAASAGKQGLSHLWAGKTGTTSDNRDAWFVGFSPFETTLTWVGYDDNTSSQLTGASGPLPIWIQYTQFSKNRWPATDFVWPQDTEIKSVDLDQLKEKGFSLETEKNVELVFED